MAKLTESLSVLLVVQDVIESTPAHDRLKKGRPDIVCLLREGSWSNKGKTVYAKVYKADAKVRAVAKIDVFLVVNESVWNALDDKTRRALIDHELCHIEWDITPSGELKTDENGRPIWAIVPHDYEDFTGVIKRHGMWTSDAKRFFKATADYVQLDLFSQAEVTTGPLEPPNRDLDLIFDILFDAEGRPIFTEKEE